MYYICINNKKILSILNYKPNVPSVVDVVEISDNEYNLIINKTHIFDTNTNTIIQKPISAKDLLNKRKEESKKFLDSTDWQILRHLREKALKISTTLSKEAFIQLEQQREEAARILSS